MIEKHTSRGVDVCPASDMAGVETINQLVQNFVQSIPSDGSYGSHDSLPEVWQTSRPRRDERHVFYLALKEEGAQNWV